MTDRPRVALLSARLTLFDANLPVAHVTQMEDHAARCAQALGAAFDVYQAGVMTDDLSAAAVRDTLGHQHVDAIVYAPAMAAPPTLALTAIAGTDAPLVVWDAPAVTRLPRGDDPSERREHSTTVGCAMFMNALRRLRRTAVAVTAAIPDESAIELLHRRVRGASAAGSLRGSTFLRVGEPIPGLVDTYVTAEALADLGVREVGLDLEGWNGYLRHVHPERADAFLLMRRRLGWKGEAAMPVQSAVAALALQDALDGTGAVAGTINCHSQYFRSNPELGIPACLGVASATSEGRPVACTGDQPAAICMYLARRISGGALFCELYTPEVETGLVLLGVGGEPDLNWSESGGEVAFETNHRATGDRGAGTGLRIRLRRGPATLMSLSPGPDGWVLAWGTGEVVEDSYTPNVGVQALFRFDSGPSTDATARWISSGATHHDVLAIGNVAIEIESVTAALGIRGVRV